MGGNIGIDQGHGKFAEVFATEKENNVTPRDEPCTSKFQSVVKGWRFYLGDDHTVKDEPMHLQTISGGVLKPVECYLVVHTYHLNGEAPEPSKTGEACATAVAGILSEALTPRGVSEAFSGYDCSPLAYQSIFRVSKRDSAHDAYLWNGKEAPALVKAAALSKGFQMERFFVNYSGSGLHSFFHGNTVVAADTLMPSEWKENKNSNVDTVAVQRNHLLYSLLSACKQKGHAASKGMPRVREAFVSPLKSKASSPLADDDAKAKRPATAPPLVPASPPAAAEPGPAAPEPLFVPPPREKSPGFGKGLRLGKPGMTLDLRTVNNAVSHGELDEKKQKQEKLEMFSKQLSKISDNVYMGGDLVARNKDMLKEQGITHVINCAGNVCDNYFPQDFEYRTFFLKDGPSEDITLIFYECIDMMEDVIEQGGKIFVHCYQGVSRSSAVVIVHMMWRNKVDYDTAFKHVKSIRGIANPNTAFMVHLMEWSNRRTAPKPGSRLFRVCSHNDDDPMFLVARPVPVTATSLDCRGCYVVVTKEHTFLWAGSKCIVQLVRGGLVAAQRLQRYEGAAEVEFVREGAEQDAFWQALGGKAEVGEVATFADYGAASKIPRIPIPPTATTLDQILAVPLDCPPSPKVRTDDGSPKAQRKAFVDGSKPFMGTAGAGNVTSRIRTSSIMSPRPNALSKPSHKNEPRLFQHPDWDQLCMFDSDDLEEDGAFALVVITAAKREVTVWMGSNFESEVRDQERLDKGQQLATDCLKENGLPVDDFEKRVVLQDEEPEDFWDLFVNG